MANDTFDTLEMAASFALRVKDGKAASCGVFAESWLGALTACGCPVDVQVMRTARGWCQTTRQAQFIELATADILTA